MKIKNHKSNFKFTFLLSISAVVLISMLLVYTIQKQNLRLLTSYETEKNLKKSLYSINEEIAKQKSDLLNKGIVITEDPQFIDALSTGTTYTRQLILSKYMERFPEIWISIYDIKGIKIGETYTRPQELNYLDIASKEKSIEEYSHSMRSAEIISIGSRIFAVSMQTVRSNGKVIGTAALASEILPLSLSKLKDFFELDINIYNKTGKLIYSSSNIEVNSISLTNDYSISRTKKYIAAAKYFPSTSLGVEVLYSMEILRKLEKAADSKIWYINAFLLLLILIILNIFATKIIEPINLIIEGINRVKNGDLKHSIRYPSTNEIGDAINHFNLMTEKLALQKENEEHISSLDKIASVGRLAASVAHEIKNPLSSISMIINMYNDDFGSIEFEKRDFEIMSKEIKRINEIISKLLDFSKTTPLKIIETDINQIFEEMVFLVAKKAKENNISISTAIPQIKIKCDENLVKQAVLNLLLNSIDAAPNGSIEISGNTSDGNATIVIKDTGIGMTPEELHKATEPFYSTKSKGTGIGLAVVKKIFNIHKFNFNIESEKNVGTTVYIGIDLKKNGTLEYEILNNDFEILERRN